MVNRIHQGLEDANVQLSSAINDILGVAGLRMVRAMVAGETDAEVLSQCGNLKLRAAQAALHASLPGKFTDASS